MPDITPQTWEAAAAILDAAPICHVAFVEGGQPRALPAAHARVGASLYLHGSPASTVIRAAASGAPLSISAVVLDGVVVAHSACKGGINYRSVLLEGTGREVEDAAEITLALRAITERFTVGAWQGTRLPQQSEIAATAVARVDITAYAIRARSGPAREDEADRALPGWTGVVPLLLQAGPGIPDPGVAAGLTPPVVLPGCLTPRP